MQASLRPLFPTFVIASLVALVAGCASPSASTGAGASPKRGLRTVEAPGGKPLPADMRAVFTTELENELFTKNFTHGNDLVLKWKVADYDKGSRALRYVVGFGAGQGNMYVDATLTDAKGRVLGSTRGRGMQTIGLFGGSFDSAIKVAADEVADFAVKQAYPQR